WRDMCRNAGLELEALTGGYLLRWAGNPLDNTRTWVRLNQVWGALFPSLGGEVLVKARLTSPVVAQTSGNSQRRSAASTGSLRWAGRAAAALAILLGAGLFLWWHEKPGCPVEALARSHQDGNNVFYAVAHPVLNEISDTSGVVIVQCATEFARLFSEYSDAGRDVHLFVTEEHMHTVAEPRQHLRIVGQTSLNGTSLYLLGREG
ncbi:MAG TPA: hypothetical protein VLH60_06410, partial [Sedimentisphaerales bacterium]|nr:hypothetical protein [Sedimentisphaerales bacterium]